MAHVILNLKAGKATRQGFGPSKYLTLSSLGGAASVDVDLEVKGFPKETIRGMKERDRVAVDNGTFESATFTAPIDCTIEVFASMVDLRLNNNEGGGVLATIVGPLPLPVQNQRGDPGNPLYAVGMTLTDAPAVAVTDLGAVAVSPAGASLAAANVDRRELRFRNLGPDPVALGGVGVAWAARVIVLDVDDVWVEARGANLRWDAICDAGKAASVTVQEVRS